jgi:hypothetical protein
MTTEKIEPLTDELDDFDDRIVSPAPWTADAFRLVKERCGRCGRTESHKRGVDDHHFIGEQDEIQQLRETLSLERTARQKAEERVRELEDVISGCVLCSSPDTRWDEAMARYRSRN